MTSHIFDIVICGAGIAGIATAYYLATEHNIENILLIDKRPPLTFTSDKSGSNYRNWWPHPSMTALSNLSIDLMDQIAHQHNNFFHINRNGYLYFSEQSDIDALLTNHQHTDSNSIRIHERQLNPDYFPPNTDKNGIDILLGNRLIQSEFPFVNNAIQSAMHIRRAGWLNTRVLAMYMLSIANEKGTTQFTGEVTAIDSQTNIKQIEVTTNDGHETIMTHNIVLASGPFLPQTIKMLNLSLPINNVLQQKILLQDTENCIPTNTPFMIFRDPPPVSWSNNEQDYFSKHVKNNHIPGNLHIRKTNNKWIIAGWAFNRQHAQPIDKPQPHKEFPQVLLRGLSHFIPQLEQYSNHLPQPVIQSAGYYTKTPENLPIIGETNHKGVYIIGALSGFGVMVACGAGNLLSKQIATDRMPVFMDDFAVRRFNDPAYLSRMPASDGEL